MSQAPQADCQTSDATYYFNAKTDGNCNNHCEIGDTRQQGVRLSVEIENPQNRSSYYIYVSLQSSTGNLNYRPEFHICRPLNARSTITTDFEIWHDGQTTNITDTINIELYYCSSWGICNGKISNKKRWLQSMNLNLAPEFEYV